MMRLTEMRVQVEKRGGGVAADGALLGFAGPEVDRVDVAREGTCGERQIKEHKEFFCRAKGSANLAPKCWPHRTSCLVYACTG